MKNLTQFLISLLVICFLSVEVSYGQVAGQIPLNPTSVPQFVDPLPHFAGLRVDAKAGGDLYVKAVPHQQVAVSTGTILGNGTVGVSPGAGLANFWVYQVSKDGTNFTPPFWPAFTIEAERGNPLNVHYSNELTGQSYENVGLVVDQTLHWANPNALPMNDPLRFNPFTDEPPITVHLHGGEVSPLSDGGPDSWFTPGNALTGHSYNPGPYVYPNSQEAATLWFHDHALGVTRLNVYAGMAGFYFLRGGGTEDALKLPGWSGDDLVQEVAPPGASGVFNPNPYLPEIEIVIQDRMFDTNGQLYFPNLPANPLNHPFWTPEFEGDIITVNGKTWPYLSVAPRKYRFRILNGSNARTYELWLQDLVSGISGPAIYQIGTDGGFLDAPVMIDPAAGGKLVLMPGERVDVVIDFAASAPGAVWTMRNSAKTPYPKGAPVKGSTLGRIMQFVVNGTMLSAADSLITNNDPSMLPASLTTNVSLTDFVGGVTPGVTVSKIRQLTLNEVMGPGGPLEALVNNTKWAGESVDKATFIDGIRPDFSPVSNGDTPETFTYYSETMDEGKTEIWKIINLTGDAHPIHLHLVQCQLMSRQKFNTNKYNKAYDALFPGGVFIGGYGPPLDYNTNQTPLGIIPTIGGNPDITPYLQGPPKPANPNEMGWKDTYIMYPGEVTTIIVRWAPTDMAVNTPISDLYFPFDPSEGYGYVWHCHIIDHEDNEMMRPYQVIANPANPNAPAINFASAKKSAGVKGNSADFDMTSQNAPDGITLEQNMPNPFNDETRIRFSLPESAHVELLLINSLGQVTTLINDVAPAGLNTAVVNAGELKAGIYFYQLRTGNVSLMKKMVIMK